MQDCRGDMLSREPDTSRLTAALLRSAMALVDDPAEARALVARALEAAHAAAPQTAALDGAEVFRLLRQAYHSVERSRPRRRMRDASVNALAAGQAPTRKDGSLWPGGAGDA